MAPPTSSPLEGLRKMTKLVNHLMSRQDASPFCEPVAWRELELWDYPKIVTKMMDLGTVKRKLERNTYANAYECALDVRLVWSNCQTYNSDGSDFWLLAKSLSRRFEDRYKKLKSEFDMGEPDVRMEPPKGRVSSPSSLRAETPEVNGTASPSSLDNKAALSERIFLLSGMELGHVVSLIEQQAPHALETIESHHPNNTSIEIVIDALPPRTFAELDKYTREKVGNRNLMGTGHASGPPLKKSKKNR